MKNNEKSYMGYWVPMKRKKLQMKDESNIIRLKTIDDNIEL